VRTTAAALREPNTEWEILELDLDPPRQGEVLLRVEYSGLCHSDEHVRKGAFQRYPVIGGHEGAGVIETVGPGVAAVDVGDHVVTSFLPRCGACRWCLTGRSYLCDAGATLGTGELLDGTFRFHLDGVDVGAMCLLGTFSQWTVVPATSVVKIPDDIPLDAACLLACGVPTGWGSAVHAAHVRPGDVVVVYGVGGVGINAVQGAALAGARTIVAIDPVAYKRERARELGAHYGFASHEEAFRFLVDHTRGVMADATIVVPGNVAPDVVAQAVDATAKGGTIVLTGMSDPLTTPNVQLHGTRFSSYAKTLVGTLYGNCNPHLDIPRLAGLYRDGRLKLDELITTRYALKEINEGYRDMHAGRNLRGVLVHEH
jgi:S-(hydroxymethyl)glutathione dehydrogenase/alcohol dehydrogenase